MTKRCKKRGCRYKTFNHLTGLCLLHEKERQGFKFDGKQFVKVKKEKHDIR